ncbi:MAG: hypothetical protein ACTHJ9_10485 [Rhodanobacter sp.]
MKSLRAFVGHSFTAEDEDVVRRFLTYFDAIQEINPEFSWEHAEHSEPSAIDEKVLRFFEGKNIFIGICTRKELVLQPAQVMGNRLFRNRCSARRLDLVWKTSDWVIQEIGLAFGRGLKVILLLEDGVRQPGGIQGSLEYIPFDREAPEKSFSKLLQMIGSLSPANEDAVDMEPGLASTSGELKKEKVEADWLTPSHSWRRRDYENAFMHLTAVGDFAGASTIGRAFLQSSFNSEIDSWNAFTAYIQFLFGKDGRLEPLKKLAANSSANADVLRYLALAYRELGEDRMAAETFAAAAEVETEKERRVHLLGNSVEAALEKNQDLAEVALRKARDIAVGDPSLNSSLLAIENAFSKAKAEKGFMFAALERLLEEAPDNHSKRFELAYAYAEAGMEDMALYHYQRVPSQARSEGLWNNLGVSFDNQKLPIKSVAAYKEAKELGSTLAMSNLAQRYLHAGFLDEARAVCEMAAKVPNHHKNVDDVLTRASKVLDDENELEKRIIFEAKDVSEFNRKAGAALVAAEVEVSSGWLYEGVSLSVVVTGTEFRAQGLGEEKMPVLKRFPGEEGKSQPYEIVIVGKIRGRAVQGSYEKKRKRSPLPLSLLGANEQEDLLLYISEDGGSIEVLRRRGGEKAKRSTMIPFVADRPKAESLGDALGAAS